MKRVRAGRQCCWLIAILVLREHPVTPHLFRLGFKRMRKLHRPDTGCYPSNQPPPSGIVNLLVTHKPFAPSCCADVFNGDRMHHN